MHGGMNIIVVNMINPVIQKPPTPFLSPGDLLGQPPWEPYGYFEVQKWCHAAGGKRISVADVKFGRDIEAV